MKLNILAALAVASAQQKALGDFNTLQLNSLELEAINKIDPTLDRTFAEIFENHGAEIQKILNKKKDPVKFERRNDWDIVATSSKFPNHQIRVREPKKLGHDHVKQWSGYIDVLDEDKHFFFWFFESRSDPENDPVVMWLNGGPGCSSSTGNLFELGPSAINENLTLSYNPYAWNNKANVFFLDQPVNVGFSYSTNSVSTSTLAAVDVYAFLSLFFEEFPKYGGRDFHIAGESYCGHYLPAIGYEILQHDDRNFNLTSVIIGNGITDALNQADSQVSMACGAGGYPSVLSAETCDKLYAKVPRAQQLLQACYDTKTPLVCVAAAFYSESLSAPYQKTGRNVYDIRDVCGDECYPQLKWVEDYLNQDHVQKELGVETIKFTGCSDDVFTRFGFNGDLGLPFHPHVAAIMSADVPVLIYAGDKDYICNWLGNRDWTNKLEWPHHDEFSSGELKEWYVDGKAAGAVKSAGQLTFLRVYDAGHMVPFNQPKSALVMLNEWLSGNLTLDSEL